MLHVEAKRLLSAYLDNALDRERFLEVKQHLETCSSCVRALDEIKSGAALTSVGRPEVALDEFTRDRLRKRLNPVRSSILRYKLTTAATLLFLVLGGVYFFLNRANSGFKENLSTSTKSEGALPLDLLVQEAAIVTPKPEWDTEPYAKLTTTKTELENFTGQGFREPEFPADFHFVRGFVYQQKYGGAIGRIYSSNDGRQIVAIFEQPKETPMAYPPRNPQESSFLGKDCIEVRWPTLRLFSWVTEQKRTMVLSNMRTDQLQPLFLNYPGLHR
jgi:hypothetical protein